MNKILYRQITFLHSYHIHEVQSTVTEDTNLRLSPCPQGADNSTEGVQASRKEKSQLKDCRQSGRQPEGAVSPRPQGGAAGPGTLGVLQHTGKQ